MPLGTQVIEDYRTLRLTLKRHPLALLRGALTRGGYVPSQRFSEMANGQPVKVAGLVLMRQRPGTANGIIFATLEDEAGVANIVIWPKLFERYRRTVLTSTLLGVTGRLQREGIVIHVVAERLVDLSRHLRALADGDNDMSFNDGRPAVRDPAFPSRDFH
jgi:error-prone DNA polymerase